MLFKNGKLPRAREAKTISLEEPFLKEFRHRYSKVAKLQKETSTQNRMLKCWTMLSVQVNHSRTNFFPAN